MLHAKLAERRQDKDEGEDYQAAQNVQGVETRHNEIAGGPKIAEWNVRRQVHRFTFLFGFFQYFVDLFADFYRTKAGCAVLRFLVLDVGHGQEEPIAGFHRLGRETGIGFFGDMNQLGADPFRVALSEFFDVQSFTDVAGQDIVLKLGVVFHRLDHKKHNAQGERGRNVANRLSSFALAENIVGQYDGQAAANQHEGIDGPHPLNEM